MECEPGVDLLRYLYCNRKKDCSITISFEFQVQQRCNLELQVNTQIIHLNTLALEIFRLLHRRILEKLLVYMKVVNKKDCNLDYLPLV
jgi:hypothetical protein